MIYIGSDYRGFKKKQFLIDFFKYKNYQFEDMGAFEYVEGDDFNDPAIAVAKAVKAHPGSAGILLCGSAHGVTIQANRFKGIRAAHCGSVESAKLAREHDAANVLCLSAELLEDSKAREIVMKFLTTRFKPLERRIKRIKRIDERGDYA